MFHFWLLPKDILGIELLMSVNNCWNIIMTFYLATSIGQNSN